MKRSKEEILESILELCREPVGLTKIVYQCNLNFRTVRIYLEQLIDAGLLSVLEADNVKYRTTSKGLEALEHCNAFRSLLASNAKSEDEVAV
ncbi:MAG TPA: winged helix-turn-helix domain-containing protein [Methanothrix sp.]|nr:winged helix-turn-helix domain-containing protein [Methanothrix sp.]